MAFAATPALANQPSAPALAFAFEETVLLAPDIPVGPTALGKRNIVPITGGTFSGPGIKGTIIPGGWDWQLGRADGCLLIEADYMLRTDDNVVINIHNKGVACRDRPMRTQVVFEAPLGKYDWLSKTAFIGTLEPMKVAGQPAVHITIYKAI
jgi:hypothetical protein